MANFQESLEMGKETESGGVHPPCVVVTPDTVDVIFSKSCPPDKSKVTSAPPALLHISLKLYEQGIVAS